MLETKALRNRKNKDSVSSLHKTPARRRRFEKEDRYQEESIDQKGDYAPAGERKKQKRFHLSTRRSQHRAGLNKVSCCNHNQRK